MPDDLLAGLEIIRDEVEQSDCVVCEPVSPQPYKRIHGRPSLFSPELSEAIIGAVRSGLSPTRAASKCGIHHSTIPEWRERYPAFSAALDQAEADYVQDRIKDLEGCATKWGTKDPKALELLLRRFPEFRQHQEISSTSISLNASLSLNGDHLQSLAARHIASLGASE